MATKKKRKPKIRYGLFKHFTCRKSRDFLDMDYIDKIKDPKVLDWLDKFSREYYQNTFCNTSADLHRTKEEKRICYTNENAKQRDVWNQNRRVVRDMEKLVDDGSFADEYVDNRSTSDECTKVQAPAVIIRRKGDKDE